MATIDNEQVVRGFYEKFVNEGNPDRAGEFLAPDVAFYLCGQLMGSGPGVFVQLLTTLRAAFPDLHTTVEDVVSDGDMVCERVVTRGTHLGQLSFGPYQSIPPTGRRVEWQALSMFRVVGGRIVENWAMPDQLALLQQVGAIPSVGPAGIPGEPLAQPALGGVADRR